MYHELFCISMQEFQPDVIIANAIWPAGAYVADRLNIPKVAFSVVAPFGPVVNVPSATAAWPSLGPVLPHWLPQPLGFWARLQNLYNVWRGYSHFVTKMDPIMSKPWRQGGLSQLGFTKSLQNSAAWIFQGDNAWLPAIPLSPHVHLVGGLTAAEPQPLPQPFKGVCEGADETGLVYVSMGTTNQPDAELVLGMFDAFAKQTAEVLWVIADRDQQLLADQGLRVPPHVHVTAFAPQNSVFGSSKYHRICHTGRYQQRAGGTVSWGATDIHSAVL